VPFNSVNNKSPDIPSIVYQVEIRLSSSTDITKSGEVVPNSSEGFGERIVIMGKVVSLIMLTSFKFVLPYVSFA